MGIISYNVNTLPMPTILGFASQNPTPALNVMQLNNETETKIGFKISPSPYEPVQVMGLSPLFECCIFPTTCVTYPITLVNPPCVSITFNMEGDAWGCQGTLLFHNPNGGCPPWGADIYAAWSVNVNNMTCAALVEQIVGQINGYGNQSYFATANGCTLNICTPTNSCNWSGATITVVGLGPTNSGEMGGYVNANTNFLTFGNRSATASVEFIFSGCGCSSSIVNLTNAQSSTQICNALMSAINSGPSAIYQATCICATSSQTLPAFTPLILAPFTSGGNADSGVLVTLNIVCGATTYPIAPFYVSGNFPQSQSTQIANHINSLTSPSFPFTAAADGYSWIVYGVNGQSQNGCVVNILYQGKNGNTNMWQNSYKFVLEHGQTTVFDTSCNLQICAPGGPMYNFTTVTMTQSGNIISIPTTTGSTVSWTQQFIDPIPPLDCLVCEGVFTPDGVISNLQDFVLPVFATSSSFLQMNDINTWLLLYPPGYDAVNNNNFVLQQLSGCDPTNTNAWNTVAVLNNYAFGVPYNNNIITSNGVPVFPPINFPQYPFYDCSGLSLPTNTNYNYQGFQLSWQKVLNNFGPGIYRFSVQGSIIASPSPMPFCQNSNPFNLKIASCTSMDLTVRFESTICGGNQGSVDSQNTVWNFDLTNDSMSWSDSIRFAGELGYQTIEIERDQIKYQNGLIEKVRDEIIKTYTLKTSALPKWLLDRFSAYAMMSDTLLATDNNLNNADYAIVRLPVVADSGVKPNWQGFTRVARVIDVTFKSGQQEIYRDRC